MMVIKPQQKYFLFIKGGGGGVKGLPLRKKKILFVALVKYFIQEAISKYPYPSVHVKYCRLSEKYLSFKLVC